MGNASTKATYPKSLAGTGSASKRVHWSGPGLPAPPGKPILVPGTEETQPDVVSIRWERSPSNGGSAIVGYLVEHRRMGSPHWVRATPVLCTFPELTLSGLEPGWRYQFRVRAQNAIGLSEPSELSDPLTVTLQRSAASTPHFDLELKDTVALENEQAEFVVQFSGTPLPKISWFKDGFEIFSSRRTRIITENGKSSLLIHQTALNDEGEIKCTATNRVGHISTKAKLVLEAPPRIRLPRQYEDGLLFEQDETIRLKVSLAGRPLPSVTWLHDGEVIPVDQRHIIESMEGECVLKIPDAKRADRGEYTVKASNKLGEDISSFLVTVTDRPSAPGKAIVTMTLGRSVTLSWKEPDDDGGCKIGTYIVEYYRIGWDVWLKATTCRQLTTTLGELIEGSEYRFRVKAENPYGVSDPSEESDVVFVPDLKRGITEPPLKGKSQSQRDINKTKEKREVSFAEPVQRTRSLTREEAARGVREPSPEWTSTKNRSVGRLSRADEPKSIEKTATDAKSRPNPDLPTRARKLSKQEKIEAAEALECQKANESPGTSPNTPTPQKGNLTFAGQKTLEPNSSRVQRSAFRESKSRSLSRERSLSPSPMPKIQESHEELLSATPLATSTNLVLQKQKTADSLPVVKPPSFDLRKQNTVDSIPLSPTSPRENDVSMLHGSSEFMLVLLPEEETKRISPARTNVLGLEGMQIEVEPEAEDLVPPPLSLSLPELFSVGHEVVEILREAVSSTELLHERAMERFYHAVAIEEAELAKRKAQTEKRTGELAGLSGNASQKGEVRIKINSLEAIDCESPERRLSLRRRLSNTGFASQLAWQTQRDRRRSSEGQNDVPVTLSPRSSVLLDASSDPNLTIDHKFAGNIPVKLDQPEKLHRWDSKNMPLSVEDIELEEESTATVEAPEKGVESVETSVESSEEESSDSEDLKLLKARILAQPIIDEEDTYHPRGRPVQHVSPDPPEVPDHAMLILDIPPPVPTRPVSLPSSPTNLVPKSILKKRTETDVIPLNQFGRPVPPEKPIRKSLQSEESSQLQSPGDSEEVRPEEPQQQTVTLRKKSLTSIPDSVKGAAISESDIDNSNVLSAAEVARTRRRQLRQASLEEEAEATMAVVSYYTEIVNEHAVSHKANGTADKTGRKGVVDAPKNSPETNAKTSVISKKELTERTVSPTPKTDVGKGSRKSIDREKQVKVKQNCITPKETTPVKDHKDRSNRKGRTTSRNESPVPKSRNASKERGSSRPSSRAEIRGVSQEKSFPQRGRPTSRTTSEDSRSSREKSLDKRKSSRSNSRSNSKDRFRPETPTKVKVERLQQALGSRKYRSVRQHSDTVAESTADVEKKVRSTISYLTDLTLLTAAAYVYFLKSEILAIPFIGLLLYRQIQEEIERRLPKWWKRHK